MLAHPLNFVAEALRARVTRIKTGTLMSLNAFFSELETNTRFMCQFSLTQVLFCHNELTRERQDKSEGASKEVEGDPVEGDPVDRR